MRTRLLGIIALSNLTLAACVSTPDAPDAATLETDEKVLFSCAPSAASPHPRLDVLEITMTPEELATAKEVEKDAAEESPGEPDTITLEKTVRIAIRETREGNEGHCYRKVEGGKYHCQTFDGGFFLEWDENGAKDSEPKGPAPVKVKEKWLFGTKEYIASCTHKA